MLASFKPKGYGWKQHPGLLTTKTTEVVLSRESGNVKDPNAIRVLSDGSSAGWVPRELAESLAPVIDNGGILSARVVQEGVIEIEQVQ